TGAASSPSPAVREGGQSSSVRPRRGVCGGPSQRKCGWSPGLSGGTHQLLSWAKSVRKLISKSRTAHRLSESVVVALEGEGTSRDYQGALVPNPATRRRAGSVSDRRTAPPLAHAPGSPKM